MAIVPRSEGDLRRLINEAVPEGPSLDYKATLDLTSRARRLELLKDVSGMGNGGGGTLIFGVAEESDGEDGIPVRLSPLEDRGVVGVLEDIVRAGVRPPLLVSYRTIEADDGFVLVVEAARSPLGPYMIDAYDDRRFYTRIGTRTVPMGEQQVRDAYLLSARARENRDETWQDHDLPLTPQDAVPWLLVAGIPEEPRTDLLDPGVVQRDAFRPPSSWNQLLELGDLGDIVGNVARWADGVYSENGHGDRLPTRILRIHRDGAAAVGIALHTQLGAYWVARAVNALVGYLAWVWDLICVCSPIELDIRLDELAEASLARMGMFDDDEAIRQPTGVSMTSISVRREVLPSEAVRASTRHMLTMDFADRLAHAFGRVRAEPMFRSGQLYGPGGLPLGLSLAGNGIWGADRGGTQQAFVYGDGSIRNTARQLLVGFHAGGAVIDEAGDTMAVLEMAPGTGCPDDFLPQRLHDDPRATVPGGSPGSPFDPPEPLDAPGATGLWSENSLQERVGVGWTGP